MPETDPQPTNGTPTGNPSPSPATSGTGSAAESQPWRAGPNADPRLQGKTAEEILGIAGALLTVAEKFNQPVPQPMPVQQPSRFDLDLPDDDYIQGKDVKRILQQVAMQPAPVDYAARQQAAGALLATVQMQRADEFRRWAGEIRAELSKLPIEHWTLDNLNTIVNIVKSNHIDELAAEKAQRLVDESHPTIRSGTGGSGSGTQTQPIWDSGPQDMLARLKAVGIASEAELRDACQGTGIEPAQYLAELEKYGKKGALIRG